ncbi:hypothetical protein [Saccharopolyspora pogona]|uniref:hypothetical protein n=1 Tax=Saccharopolyspora pogona TaxID=333966 RepID=UPI0016838031|nr:hypothetical protein [Saccharopolyspora pogona]
MAISISKPRTVSYLGREATRTTYQHDDGTGPRVVTTKWTDNGAIDVRVHKGRRVYAEKKNAGQIEVDDMLLDWLGLFPPVDQIPKYFDYHRAVIAVRNGHLQPGQIIELHGTRCQVAENGEITGVKNSPTDASSHDSPRPTAAVR